MGNENENQNGNENKAQEKKNESITIHSENQPEKEGGEEEVNDANQDMDNNHSSGYNNQMNQEYESSQGTPEDTNIKQEEENQENYEHEDDNNLSYQINRENNIYQINSANQEINNIYQVKSSDNAYINKEIISNNENISNNINNSKNEEGNQMKIVSNIKKVENSEQNAYKYSQFYGNIPRYISFQKSPVKTSANVRSSLNVVKKENTSELIEIPRDKYGEYKGRETVFIGGGMDTGEYTFKGQGVIITQGEIPEQNFIISEEEIQKEINRRKNKPKKEKKIIYEVLDKFYAVTEFDGKPIKKIEKIEKIEKNQKEFYQQEFNYIGNSFQSGSYQQMNNSEIQNFSKKEENKFNFKKLGISYPIDDYSKYLFEQINNLRKNPQNFIKVIEDSKKNVIKDKYGNLVYNGKLKIALKQGISSFDNAINFLNQSKPAEKLIYNPYIIPKMPSNENEIKNYRDLSNKVDQLLNDGIQIESYWRDVIQDPELSFLMMIIDDNGTKSGMRRKDLLDPKMKYIGINSVEINGRFVAYITLAKEQ